MRAKISVSSALALLAGVILLALAAYLALQPPPEQPADVVAPAPVHPTPAPVPATNAAVVTTSPAPSSASAPDRTADASPARIDPDVAVFRTPEFLRTDTARRWREQGVTDADVAAAIAMLRERRFAGPALRDPGLISQFLPARNIEPVYIESVTLPASAAAGQPVPFSLQANYPSPAYTFERWDVRVDGFTVTLRPLGMKSGEPTASVVVPVELKGELPALAPGEYAVRFDAIGEPLQRALKIE